MIEATVLTDRFERALVYTAQVHGGQLRKGTGTPYLSHLLAVAATVLEYGGDEDTAIGALLHDAAEDQGGRPRLADIQARFGARVGAIVEACSDSLEESGVAKPPWAARKEAYIAHLGEKDAATLLVSLADKAHNARAILRDASKDDPGAAVWGRFSQPRGKTLWYYESLAARFAELLPGQLAEEFAETVRALRAAPH